MEGHISGKMVPFQMANGHQSVLRLVGNLK